jgi:hypothetical protein
MGKGFSEEVENGEVIGWYKDMAKEFNVYLSLGGF